MGKPKLNGKSFEDTVEAELSKLLKQNLTTDERLKCLHVAVRWAAVKARIPLPEQGSAFAGLTLEEDLDA